MSLITSQQINKYYDLYKNVDVTFTKEVIRVTGLISQQTFIKCIGEQWPCIIYSSSLLGAKIIVNVKDSLFEKIRKANNVISLRFSFHLADKADPLTFFVAAKVNGTAPYGKENSGLSYLNLSYTQRPPDDLIEILGSLLEANINSKKRKDERILITKDSIRKMGLAAKDSYIYIQQVPRKCILRDLSFSGAKVIVMGVAKFLVDKPAVLRIELEEPRIALDIKGKIVRFEAVEGRKDLAALAVQFDEQAVPMEYKIRLNEYLVQLRKAGIQPEQPA